MEIKQSEMRAILKPDFHKNDLKKLDIAASYSNILVSDISRFYSTIYTHVIPWALHGKAWCKAHLHTPALNSSTGNMLDVSVRKGQENQTIGIPIGPDTSRIISELIGIAIDEKLEQMIEIDHGRIFRNVDDWFIGFDGAGEAEDAIAFLANACKEYELELNSEKTKILLPTEAIEPVWPTELRRHRVTGTGRQEESSLNHYFLKTFDYMRQFPAHNVLDYALKRARSFRITPSNWPLFEAYICKCVRASMLTMPIAAEILINYNYLGYNINKQRISKLISDTLTRNLPPSHDGEIAWALFLAKGLHITIRRSEAIKLSAVESSVCALIALDLRSMGLMSSALDTSLWEQYLTQDGLVSNMWLLAYEAQIKGWLSGAVPNHVSSHTQFAELERRGVHFYDTNKNVPNIRRRPIVRRLRSTYFTMFHARSI